MSIVKDSRIWASSLGGNFQEDLKRLSSDRKTYTDFEGDIYKVIKITNNDILLEYVVEEDGI